MLFTSSGKNIQTMTHKIFALAALAGLIIISCKKNPVEKPIACDEEVAFSHKHFCSGYVLKRKDGSYLRAIEHTKGGKALETFFDGRQEGEKLKIGFINPQSDIDCAWEDSIRSRLIRIGCSEWVTSPHFKE